MDNIVESVAIHPSLVREQWLSLDVAIQEMVEFENTFGTEQLLLACHAALPSYLTPELINLIRINFLDTKDMRVPWVAESDVLLSSLCRPIDDTLFEVEPMIREVLVFELEERFGWERLQELANFLLGYLKEKQIGRLRPSVAQVQELIALSYLNPDLVIQELKKTLVESVDQEKDERKTLRGKFQVATTIELLADALERNTTQQQEYYELVHSARLLARVIFGKKETLRFGSRSEQTEVDGGNKLARLYPPEVQHWIRTIVRRATRTTFKMETPLLEVPTVLQKDEVEKQIEQIDQASKVGFVGKNHAELSAWLSQTWLIDGPPICVVEGFSGVGKTTIARALMLNSGRIAVMVDMPDTGSDQFDDVLLDLASELSLHGVLEMANAIDSGTSLPGAFEGVLRNQVLIIVDEFQRALDASGRPIGAFGHLLERIAKRPNFPGRLLLLSNRSIERGKWSEIFSIKTLSTLEPEAAELLLDDLLEQTSRSPKVPHERRRNMVNWLGCNPSAIRVLVASLEQDSLDELIGLNPESWELRDRQVSPELLERLERELLEPTLSHLNAATNTLLRQFSVHRKSVKREALEKLLPVDTTWASTRDELISRFLMEQHSGWFTLNPIVREISLQRLKQNPAELRLAHSNAADHYMRHFTAKNIVGGGQLVGYFVEVRYHLVQAQREKELSRIAGRFENHLKEAFTSVSPIPKEPNELNERIAVLSALLETPGSKGLEYYLARLYVARGAPNDLPKALTYAQRATGPRAPAASWLLRIQLEGQINGTEKALQIAREGIGRISPNQGLDALYVSCGELLAQAGRPEEAITLLKEGIGRIPPNQNLFALYVSCGELLAQAGRLDEAITLLHEGLRRIPPKQGLGSLYHSSAELLAQAGRGDEAIVLLKEGIGRIPSGQNLAALYQSCGELLRQAGRDEEAITLLKEGIDRIPPDQGLVLMEQKDRSKILLGTIISKISSRSLQFLNIDMLREHILILGEVGSGKTSTAKSIIQQLWHVGIPSLVIDPFFTEYQELWAISSEFRREPKSLCVFRLGAKGDAGTLLTFNPFCPQLGVSLDAHITTLKDIFGSGLGIDGALKELIGRAIRNVYQKFGWPVSDPRKNREPINAIERQQRLFPKFVDFIETVEEEIGKYKSSEFRSNTEAGFLERLRDLAAGPFGAIVNSRHSLDVAHLIDRPAVIELRSIRQQDTKSFITLFFLMQLRQFCETLPRSSKLKNLIVLEEAHRLVNPSTIQAGIGYETQEDTPSLIIDMLDKLRNVGIGMMLIEQLPTKLGERIVKLPNIKVVHRLANRDDRQQLTGIINMTPEQTRYISTLKVGEAAFYAEGSAEPVLVRISNPWELEMNSTGRLSRPVNNEEIEMLERNVEEHTLKVWPILPADDLS